MYVCQGRISQVNIYAALQVRPASEKFKCCKPATPKILHAGTFYGSCRTESFLYENQTWDCHCSLPNSGRIASLGCSIFSRRDVLMLLCQFQ